MFIRYQITADIKPSNYDYYHGYMHEYITIRISGVSYITVDYRFGFLDNITIGNYTIYRDEFRVIIVVRNNGIFIEYSTISDIRFDQIHTDELSIQYKNGYISEIHYADTTSLYDVGFDRDLLTYYTDIDSIYRYENGILTSIRCQNLAKPLLENGSFYKTILKS